MVHYTFNFSWSRLVPNIYIGYLSAFGVETFANILSVYIVQKGGRRRSLLVEQIVTALCFIFSMFEIEIGSGWTLESVGSIIGVLTLTFSRSIIYLYSGELAPTSHRGMVVALSSVSGRAGSMVSPFIFNNLYYLAHKSVSLGILCFLGVISIIGTLFLVDTADKATAEVPQDIRQRHKFHTFKI